MVVAVAVVLELNALEVVVHDEVHHPCDRVRTVNGGRAAGQHLDPLDQRSGNVVQVGRPVQRAARRQPAPVDQHQSAGRTQVAQVDRGGSRRSVADVAAVVGGGLRQPVDDVFDRGQALDRDVATGDLGDRAGTGQIGRNRDARSRYFNFFDSRRGRRRRRDLRRCRLLRHNRWRRSLRALRNLLSGLAPRLRRGIDSLLPVGKRRRQADDHTRVQRIAHGERQLFSLHSRHGSS